MAVDITEQKALAAEAYRKLQVRVTMLEHSRGITGDVKRALEQRYREQYEKEIERLQLSAREKLNAERAAVEQEERKTQGMRIEQMRQALGDDLTAQSIRERIASLEASELLNLYRRSASDFERAVIAAFGPALLYSRGELGRATELERNTLAPEERDSQVTLAQKHDALQVATREIDRLSVFDERQELAGRFGIQTDRIQIALSLEEISESEANIAKAGISHDLLTIDMAAV